MAQQVPLGQKCVVTAHPGISAAVTWTSLALFRNGRPFDVTGSNNGTADTFRRFVHGYAQRDVALQGTVNGLLSQNSDATPILAVDVYDVALGQRFGLYDATGVSSTEKRWAWGLPVNFANVRGWTLADGPDYDNDSLAALSLSIKSGAGERTVAGTAKLHQINQNVQLNQGGPLGASFGFRFNSDITITNMADLGFIEDDADPNEGTFTVTLDTGESVSNNAILYEASYRYVPREGGPIFVTARYRFSMAAA